MIKWLMIRRSYLGGRLTLKLAEKLMLRKNSVCDLRAAISACTTWPTGIPEPSRLPGHSSAQTAVSGLARAPDSPSHATANVWAAVTTKITRMSNGTDKTGMDQVSFAKWSS